MLRIARLLAGLSNATDIANAQPYGSALRTASVAMALSEHVSDARIDKGDLFYVSVLRFLGCTAYAHEASLFGGGDDIVLHRAFASLDTNAPLKSAVHGASPTASLQAIGLLMANKSNALFELATAQCEVAIHMARRLAMNERICVALTETYERWDGRGEPRHLSGEGLSLITRINQVARAMVLLLHDSTIDAARVRLQTFAGLSLDPTIVAIAVNHFEELAEEANLEAAWERAVERLPSAASDTDAVSLDDVALVFADYVDLKSVHTVGHSSSVAELAWSAGATLGLDPKELSRLRHAALLHDLGAVAISTGILEKPGRLSALEWERIHAHPYETARLLHSCEAFSSISHIAGSHHERADGSGYPVGLPKQGLSLSCRILCAAETYRALLERRAYRPRYAAHAATEILHEEVAKGKLDAEAVSAVLGASRIAKDRRKTKTLSLTEREIEVLRHIARGLSEKETAAVLSISARTAHHHVTHIYKKIGVSSRAAATLYAVERGLLSD